MAEYIDREKIFPNGVFYVSAENPESSLNELINRICNLPTADVVPKSEAVLASSGAVKILIECHRYALTHDADIKKEVAREIFEEIEKLHLHITNEFDVRRYTELKKKYTEEKK